MYPTEDDFADVFESYLHKDDTIPVSKVTVGEGGEPIGNAIDKKADKQTLETFINEMETVLETVRDENTNKITHTVITDLAQRITDAENDIANAANAAETNGDSIAKILTILGKQDGETVTELASRFSALSGDYATVFAFISKVKTFLESADIADTTINRWQEIESFLQGITDTETLTGLLQQMKQEILAEIPEPQPQPTGNYLELVEDHDDYPDAPDGKIVKYVGQTNEKYTRGFDYERVAGEEIVIPQWAHYVTIPEGYPINPGTYITEYGTERVECESWLERWIDANGVEYLGALGDDLQIGDVLYSETESMSLPSSPVATKEGSGYYGVTITLQDGSVLHPKNNSAGGSNQANKYPAYNNKGDVIYHDQYYFGIIRDGKFIMYGNIHNWHMTNSETSIESPSSWQPIPSFNVINKFGNVLI